jgi:uncharacterized protein (TIGR00255 family)
MIKSMTGFSKAELTENGIKATVEIKSLNGRYLEINSRLPRTISHREIDLKDTVKSVLSRGSVSVNVALELESGAKPFAIDEPTAVKIHESLKSLNKKLKIKEQVNLDHVLTFSNVILNQENNEDTDIQWKVARKAIVNALKKLDSMRTKEGQQIVRDFQSRIKKIANAVEKIESLSVQRILDEREKIRYRIAQLFETDEIDENRIQMEIVIVANRLDVSEECVRLRSHVKFFNETLKINEPSGQKLNFLLQEMNREINTIGSKSDSAEISHIVVAVKEELERIREQVQNIE